MPGTFDTPGEVNAMRTRTFFSAVVLTFLFLAAVLLAGPGCAERRPAPVPEPSRPAEAQGYFGVLPVAGGEVRIDIVPLPEEEKHQIPIPGGHWAILVTAVNDSGHDLSLNPTMDRWTVVNLQGFVSPAYPATTLHLGAYLDALPVGMRERIACPGEIRAGAKVSFPLFIPNEAGTSIREIRFSSRHAQAEAVMRGPAE